MKTRKKAKTWRFPQFVFGVFLVFIMALFAQYAYLALFPNIYGINMKKFADSRNMYKSALYAKRGTVYDSEENVLALNVTSYTVIAYLDKRRTEYEDSPEHVVDVLKTARILAPILNMTEDYLVNLLSKDVYQVELGPGGRGITEIKKDEIASLNLPGISFIEDYKRYYPNGDFASYVIGYARDTDKGDIIGELGIEYKYDEQLKGKDGYLEYQQDRYGYKIPDTKELRRDPINGDDIYLTIDSNIQRFVESAVKDGYLKYNPKWVGVTVMEAKTGRILGTSTSPSFDPNVRNITNYENYLTSYAYEPGSTMKTYTYMCTLEKGNYDGNATYKSGYIDIGEDTINDWNRTGWGTIPYDKAYEYSSNVGIANIMFKNLTKAEYRDCLSKYGFGKMTGIDLPREVAGSIDFNYDVEYVTAGFGQGITSTAIQHLQALTMIANDGKMLKPQIISKIVNPNTKEVVYKGRVDASASIVSSSTVKKMKELMYNTVNGTDAGTTGTLYKIDGYDVIGKTGTAEIYDEKSGQYLTGDNNYLFSFAGMFPANSPEIIIYAVMERPVWNKSNGISEVVNNITRSIVKYKNMFALDYNKQKFVTYKLSSYINKNTDVVKNLLNGSNITPIIIGNGDHIIRQYPFLKTEVVSYDKVFLLTNDKNIMMPNLFGYSRADATALCKLLDIDYDINGYGKVVDQSILAGSSINKAKKIVITLADKG
ncbi:MAG: penicillin-binding transpeptidase domain-containing protein [Bacilli bacterium]